MAESFFFSSRRRHTRSLRDWSSDVCSSDLSCVKELTHSHVCDLAEAGERGFGDHCTEAILFFNGLKQNSRTHRQIGRASCRKECRSRWSTCHQEKSGAGRGRMLYMCGGCSV